MDYQESVSDADWIGADVGPDDLDPLQLLPCPFCGGAGTVFGQIECGPFFAMCFGSCGCTIGMQYDHRWIPEHKFKTREAAAEAWNRRANAELTGAQNKPKA